MARPQKNSCEYFSHDKDMRNHKKIKAIRSKFKTIGYAIWVMFLEHLTGSESNVFEYTDLEVELLAGDFDVSVTEIRSILDYCILIGLLNNNNGIINSNSLDERLAPVYAKRNRSKDKSKQQPRENGKFTAEIIDNTVVSVTEKPQSKVNKSKVNKISNKVFIAPSFEEFTEYCKSEGYIGIAERAFKGYSVADWHDAKGAKIINWKQKLQNGWFKPENLSPELKKQQEIKLSKNESQSPEKYF